MLALFVLGIIPMSLFGSYHDLTSQVPESLGITFTLLTDSAGSKGFLITLTLLLLSLFRFKPSRTEWMQKLSMLGLLLVIGFASKTGLKLMTESPRPYTELLAAEQLIETPETFYQLDTKQQANVINQISEQVSDWRTRHWQGEKDYSFPSGQTNRNENRMAGWERIVFLALPMARSPITDVFRNLVNYVGLLLCIQLIKRVWVLNQLFCCEQFRVGTRAFCHQF